MRRKIIQRTYDLVRNRIFVRLECGHTFTLHPQVKLGPMLERRHMYCDRCLAVMPA